MSHTNVCGGVRMSNSPVCWQSRGWRMISNLQKRCLCLKFGKSTWIWSWQWRVVKKATHLYVELKQLIEWYVLPEIKRAGITLPLAEIFIALTSQFCKQKFSSSIFSVTNFWGPSFTLYPETITCLLFTTFFCSCLHWPTHCFAVHRYRSELQKCPLLAGNGGIIQYWTLSRQFYMKRATFLE